MPAVIDKTLKVKILASRDAVDAYRLAHSKLYTEGLGIGLPNKHTPLLEAMIIELEKQGFTSVGKTLQEKTPEILAKFWAASNLHNLQSLGYTSMAEFQNTANKVDRDILKGMWK